jgi:hypothetical protein
MRSGVARRAVVAMVCIGSVVAALAGVGQGAMGQDSTARAKPKRAPLNSFAYGILLNSWGHWVAPREDGEPDEAVLDALLDARPAYLRITSTGNRCPHPDRPEAKRCHLAQPGNTVVTQWLLRLKAAGIKLGAGINAYYRKKKPRPVRGVIRHACALNTADTYNLYDFLFLDFPLQRSDRALQTLIDKIHRGRRCPVGGWRLIMTNDTFFHSPKAAEPADRVWIHAKRFELLDGEEDRPQDRGKVPEWKEKARLAAAGKIPSILAEDRSFIREIHRRYPKSHAVLKLEVSYQTGDRFGKLSTRNQKRLLKRWSAAQRRHGFKMIYPLYVHKGRASNHYDSRAEGTYRLIKRLICRDRPGRSNCRPGGD